ncbi:MAG: ABC transporter ATP-binding protein, partial [Anaerotignum sp.]|nr:ABC transporter ATP-binding protein [Anaerotignum sp.]
EVKFHGETIISNFPKGKKDKHYAGENKGVYKKTLEPTPDKITKLGIARTFQNIRLFKELTVLENVLIAKHMRMKANIFADTFRLNRKEEQKMKEDSLELLRILDLYDVRDEIASSLPYGKQRHLEIARALATEPTLLLLDEPAAGLNPQETDELTDFIRDVRDKFNLTIFMIEHHMNLVMDISDWIYVIDFGKQIANGTPAEIQNNQRVIDAYLGVADDE